MQDQQKQQLQAETKARQLQEEKEELSRGEELEERPGQHSEKQSGNQSQQAEGERHPALMQQILRFGVVGGLSFIIDFTIYTAILAIFGKEKLTVAIAAFFGFTISLIFNYISSMRFVFVHDENMDRRKEFTIFAVLSLIGLGLNEVLILGVLAIFDHVTFLQGGFLWNIKEWIGKIFATGVVMVYNFITRKIFIEKK